MWTYPVVSQMLEVWFFFFCFDLRLIDFQHYVLDAYMFKIESVSKNLPANLDSKFSKK